MRTPRPLVTALVAAALAASGLALAPSTAQAAANDVKINEVESNGDATDWIELRNTGTSAVDISSWVVMDENDRTLAVPAGTSIAPGGFYTVDTNLSGVTGSFGLGEPDSARVFLPDATTLIDTYSWTTHAATTYGRCPDGTGAFTTTAAATRDAANACGAPVNPNAVIWPGGSSVTTVDPVGLTTENLSGLAYEPSGTAAPGTLWAVKNGNGSTLFKLEKTGSTWAPAAGDWATGKNLDYPGGTGEPDAEGVTLTDAGPDGGIFVSTERDNDRNTVSRPAIERYDTVDAAGTSLSATRDYDLSTDLPGLGSNLGLEGIAWVPDSYLTASGFVDQNTGTAYDPSAYADHGTGLFFVGVEANGQVVAYALSSSSDSYTRVAAFNSGFPAVMDLTWEPETSSLWVVCDNTCQGRSSRLGVDTATDSATRGRFVVKASYERPTGMADLNNEGFATAPAAECSTTTYTKPVFWADDGDSEQHSLREGTLTCGNPPVTPPGDGTPTPPAPTTPATPTTPAVPAAPVDTVDPRVRVKGVSNGGVYRGKAPRLRCAATDASPVTCTVTKRTRPITGRYVLVVAKAKARDAAGNTAVSRKTYVLRR